MISPLLDAARYLPKEYAQTYAHLTTLRDESSPRLTDDIKAIAFSPDGQTLAGGGHRKILIWNVSSGTLITTLKVNKGWTRAVAFSSDGKTLASVSSRSRNTLEQRVLVDPSMPMQEEMGRYFVPHTIRLWNVKTGDTLLTFTTDTLPIAGLEFSSDSSKLLTVSEQGFFGVYDSGTGHHEHLSGSAHVSNAIGRIHTLNTWNTWMLGYREPFAVAFSKDRKIFAVGRRVVATQLCDVADAEVKLWDADTGYPLHTFKRPGGPIDLLFFSPDSKMLASVSGDRSLRNDGRNTIFIWDVENWRLLTTINVNDVGVNGVLTLEFAPDNITLASGHVNGTVQIWDLTGQTNR